ncbi:DUF5681 domain-containing protein [Arsenicibacter rosenii]|uniref:DUF5681 domain-containing protein n=1 Tax=Arsenicibacter rosenii TaxID=1750698 RepID=A0A1S2VAW1_9BACT|nr:DUF5681 domain-containing protein [Arsenicibacter rosenii]OIN55864.1 hypothetical protein BLX24_27810 [Arsenicibacter rosenii]
MLNNPNAADNLKPFPPGTSGNPKGRPKGPISQLLKEFGESSEIVFSVSITRGGKKASSEATISAGDDRTINELIAAKLLQMAMDGDIKAIREVLNRTEGRPHQSVTLSRGTEDGADLNGVTAENFDLFEVWLKQNQKEGGEE